MKYKEALELAHQNAQRSSQSIQHLKHSYEASGNNTGLKSKQDNQPSRGPVQIDKNAILRYMEKKKREKEVAQRSNSAIEPSSNYVENQKRKNKNKDDDIFTKASRRRTERHASSTAQQFANSDHQAFMESLKPQRDSSPPPQKKSKTAILDSSVKKNPSSGMTFNDLIKKAELVQKSDLSEKPKQSDVGPPRFKSSLPVVAASTDKHFKPPRFSRSYLETRKKELTYELEKVEEMLRKWDKLESTNSAIQPVNPKQTSNTSEKRNGKACYSTQRPKSNNSQASHYSDEDSDVDSFIDDTEDAGDVRYHDVVREVHKSLKFDPRKYQYVDPNDNCQSMEASYKDIEREEKRSLRFATSEDSADIKAEAERRAKRNEKKHKKLAS